MKRARVEELLHGRGRALDGPLLASERAEGLRAAMHAEAPTMLDVPSAAGPLHDGRKASNEQAGANGNTGSPKIAPVSEPPALSTAFPKYRLPWRTNPWTAMPVWSVTRFELNDVPVSVSAFAATPFAANVLPVMVELPPLKYSPPPTLA